MHIVHSPHVWPWRLGCCFRIVVLSPDTESILRAQTASDAAPAPHRVHGQLVQFWCTSCRSEQRSQAVKCLQEWSHDWLTWELCFSNIDGISIILSPDGNSVQQQIIFQMSYAQRFGVTMRWKSIPCRITRKNLPVESGECLQLRTEVGHEV